MRASPSSQGEKATSIVPVAACVAGICSGAWKANPAGAKSTNAAKRQGYLKRTFILEKSFWNAEAAGRPENAYAFEFSGTH
jgi:hypothetical protein